MGESAQRVTVKIYVLFRFIFRSKEEINNHLTDAQKTADEKVKELEV